MAYSFVPYTEEILEIQIDTDPDYQQQGLATIAAAKLIEFCLSKKIKPNWSAANQISERLARKLGYSNPIDFKIYYWTTSEE